MFSEIKKLSKHTVAYGIGQFIERFLALLTLPILLREFTLYESGIYYLIFTAIALLNILYSFGIDVAFLRFFILAKNKEEKDRILGTAFIFTIGVALVVSTIIYFSSDFILSLFAEGKAPPEVIPITIGILVFDIISLYGFLILRAEQRARKFAVLKVLKAVVIIIFYAVLLLGLHWSVIGALTANLVGSIVSLITVLPIIISNFKIKFDTAKFKELLLFGLPYLITFLSFDILDIFDRVFLEKYIDTEAVGRYSPSQQMSRIMRLFATAFAFAWQPYVLSIYDKENAKKIFARVLSYFSLIGIMIFFAGVFFLDDIIPLMQIFGKEYSADYMEGLVILPFVLSAYLFYGIYLNINIGVYITKKSIYLTYVVGAAAVVNIACNFLLVPTMGMIGAAMAKSISYFILMILMYFFSTKLYPVKYEWLKLGKLFASGSIVYAASFLTPIKNNVILELILVISFPIILLLIGFFDSEEKKKIRSLIRRIF